jgi:hypothetical protein
MSLATPTSTGKQGLIEIVAAAWSIREGPDHVVPCCSVTLDNKASSA